MRGLHCLSCLGRAYVLGHHDACDFDDPQRPRRPASPAMGIPMPCTRCCQVPEANPQAFRFKGFKGLFLALIKIRWDHRGACLVPNKARLAGFRSMADAHMRSIMPCHRPIPNNKNCICHVSQEATFYRTPHFIVRERRRDPIPRGGVG